METPRSARSDITNSAEYHDKFLSKVACGALVTFVFTSMLFCLGGVAAFCFQALRFLVDGFWTALSILDILAYLEVKWARFPTIWLPLHSWLDFFEVWALVPISIVLTYLVFSAVVAISYRR